MNEFYNPAPGHTLLFTLSNTSYALPCPACRPSWWPLWHPLWTIND